MADERSAQQRAICVCTVSRAIAALRAGEDGAEVQVRRACDRTVEGWFESASVHASLHDIRPECAGDDPWGE